MKKVAISIFILILLVGLCILNLNKGINDGSIDFFAIKTGEYYDDMRAWANYKITNEEELETFYALYRHVLPRDYDLSNNTIFVQTQSCTSGSVKVDFKRVNINRKLKFKVSTESPMMGTDDMAFWYLVAIIPNTKLNNVNVDEWKSPVDVATSEFELLYKIIIESTNLDLKNSLNIVENALKDVENIKIQGYNYSLSDDKITYALTSHDKKNSEQLVKIINNQGIEMQAKVVSTPLITDKNEYEMLKNQTSYHRVELRFRTSSFTRKKGQEIAEMLNADAIIYNMAYKSYGSLGIRINDSNIEKIESNVNIILKHASEWNLETCEILVYYI